MNPVARHASAVRRMEELEAASVEFVVTSTTYDPETDEQTDRVLLVIKGHAVEISGDMKQYQEMSLVEREPVTLFFVPTEIGDEPGLGCRLLWAGEVRKVRYVHPFRPAGTTIGAKVIVV